MGCSGTCWQDRWSSGSEFSLHTCTCTFFSFQLVFRVVGIITGYFYFIVDVCLFLYRQACRYLLIYVVLFCFMDLFLDRLIWAISLFFWRLVILVFVTCVLALCRDWSKQMSDLPFFLLLKNKLWRTELMTQNFQCMSHLHWLNCEYFAGKAQLSSKDCLWWSPQQRSMSPYLQWWELSQWDWPDE